MTKIRYWSKVLMELDTETNRVRIIKQYAQPEAGTSVKKSKPMDAKAKVTEVLM